MGRDIGNSSSVERWCAVGIVKVEVEVAMVKAGKQAVKVVASVEGSKVTNGGGGDGVGGGSGGVGGGGGDDGGEGMVMIEL